MNEPTDELHRDEDEAGPPLTASGLADLIYRAIKSDDVFSPIESGDRLGPTEIKVWPFNGNPLIVSVRAADENTTSPPPTTEPQAEIEPQPGSREALAAVHGTVWDEEEFAKEFHVAAIIGTQMVVRRRSGGQVGNVSYSEPAEVLLRLRATRQR